MTFVFDLQHLCNEVILACNEIKISELKDIVLFIIFLLLHFVAYYKIFEIRRN